MRAGFALLCAFALVACDDDGGVSNLLAGDADGADTAGAGDPDTAADTLGDTASVDTTPDTGAHDAVSDTIADTQTSADTVANDTADAVDTAGPSCPVGAACVAGGETGRCDAIGSCVFACGDGVVQPSVGEECDDGGHASGDGCRDDCVVEEPIGAGFTGGQCADDVDCAPAGASCIPEVGGGSCAVPCSVFCDDQPGSPVTFCIASDAYASRMDEAIPAYLTPALCVAKCDFERFPRTGCRAGLHCELHSRYQSSVEDEVCVPGPWSVGLRLSADGLTVLGADAGGPPPAEPFAGVLATTCGGTFQSLDARLFRALADTLSAMGADGRGRRWERLCGVPGDLPDRYTLHAEAADGRAFRLAGARLAVVDWTAAGIYGAKTVRGTLVGGPLYPVRAMVYRAAGGSYLYADAAADHPHYDPARGHHFGMIMGEEWAPLDAVVEPRREYISLKASGGALYRAWGRLDVVDYLADMARDHLAQHGVPVGVGDLSLPTGGDIDDHASHEVGRDVDLYLLSFPLAGGVPNLAAPRLWVATCTSSGGWTCSYYDNATGLDEDPGASGYVSAAALLTSLAWFAYDYEGPSHFVQHDVPVLQTFRDLPGSVPVYIDASNDEALGWPPHRNHIHIRFAD